MSSNELRKNFLDFFEKKEHKIVPSSPLVDESDPSVLLTSAGMQQFKSYYLGKESPYGDRVCSVQKCVRTSDIEEVGDLDHLTFIEMLGNFSFGDYFKKEAINWALEFLIKCGLTQQRLWITYFKGNPEIPEDEESPKIWKELGIPKHRIRGFGRKDNFWGPTGKEGPCGPTTEIHYDLTGKPCEKDEECVPNCNCGRFVELWNIVFNQYYQDQEKNLKPLKQTGVDTGMGLERLAIVAQNKKTIYEIDLFSPLIKRISKLTSVSYTDQPKPFRIIADHIRAAVFLGQEGILPSNTDQGYILRRLLRRAIRFKKVLGIKGKKFLPGLAEQVIEIYRPSYQFGNQADILTVIQKEEEKFEKALDRGLNQLDKILEAKTKRKTRVITGKEAFDLYQSYGFPLEFTQELAKEKGFRVDQEGFQEAFKRHQQVSKAGAEKKFSGIGIEDLKDKNKKLRVKKLHTATHLLHQTLRTVLGKQVKQKGSDITPERLRFDFSHPQSMTDQEIKKVERLVNKKISQDLKVEMKEMDFQKAREEGALALPNYNYPQRVKVYSITDRSGKVFSKEICAGPHVSHTGVLGEFKIIKEKSSGAGIRRIKAILKSVNRES